MTQIPSASESVWCIVVKITCYQWVGEKVIVNSQLQPTHFLTFHPSFRFYLCQPPHVTFVSQKQPFSLFKRISSAVFISMNVEHLSRNWETQGSSWQHLLPLLALIVAAHARVWSPPACPWAVESTPSGHALSLPQRWPTFFPILTNEGKRWSGLPEEDVGGVDVDLVVSNREPGTIRAELNESTRPSVVPNLHAYFWSVEKFL